MNRTLLVLGALLALAACESAPPPSPAPHATLFRLPENQLSHLQQVGVSKHAVSVPLHLPAQINFDQLKTSDITPLIDGKVAKLLVREGETVKAGEPLLAIASPDSADAEASLERDRAALQHAKSVLARDKDLYEHKAISLEELQQAELDVSSSEASLRSDQARVRITGTGPSQALLRSPIAGVVVARHVSVGQAVQAGSTATFTVTDPQSVWVVGQLYQEDLRRVAVGDPVEIHSAALEHPLEGNVIYIGASLDPDTLTIPVRIAADNPAGLLKNGMYVDVAISPLKAEQALTVPAGAVLRDDDNLPFVYVKAGTGEFARRRIELGDQVGASFIVRSGLSEGEQVIGDGALFVQFAQSLEQ